MCYHYYPGLSLFNNNFKNGKRSEKPLRPFKSAVIQPEGEALGDTLVATRALIDKRLEHGRLMAEQALRARVQFA